ncbi:AGE family epimerase/isomerase [Roseobacter sp. HKCCA0434]|uniref:AGE family epimerase/isomerase n=1 Tax=Roseobacter sp. HKCCA0434 TaxID=3079297 RepID=UPI002905F5E4|nr:AGE family epimerase/isomerase [Roseobacter sp. HKCCA0434]
MTDRTPGPLDAEGFWLDQADHRRWLRAQAEAQLAFFIASRGAGPGFDTLDPRGHPLPDQPRELHTVTRLVHSYALGERIGFPGSAAMVEHGLDYIASHHRDPTHGGYVWTVGGDGLKLAYGHAFVLLAAASALIAGHERARPLLDDIWQVLAGRYWEKGPGLFADEFTLDWRAFSTYRGMNANMHAVEALLAAHEATGEGVFLDRADSILAFFVDRIAPENDWRLPEHYTADWQIDRGYAGDPMFRPAGTTPGHSFELGRLALQHWDLSGRPATDRPSAARRLIAQALEDAWLPEGGLAYTHDFDGTVARHNRFWWPVTEAIGALATLIELDRDPADEIWYRRLWTFASDHFIDHDRGGWFPEIDRHGQPTSTIFAGKPDLYHALQACLFPLAPGISHAARGLTP